jgi:hypothetical protein
MSMPPTLKNLTLSVRNEELELCDLVDRLAKRPKQDSLSGWIVDLLKEDRTLAEYFQMPRSNEVIKAVRTILTNTSLVTQPLLKALAGKLSLYLANLYDISNHPLASKSLRKLYSDVDLVRGLLSSHLAESQKRKIDAVATAIATNRSDQVLDGWNNSAFRAVLNTLHWERLAPMDKNKRILLSFLLRQLNEEAQRPGVIAEPRHGWWALETLTREADEVFLKKNAAALNRILNYLATRSDNYHPRADLLAASIAPELHTHRTEQLWIGINVARLLRSALPAHLNEKTKLGLRRQFHDAEHLITVAEEKKSFKICTVRLLLGLELLQTHALIQAEELGELPNLNLRPYRIGESLWEEGLAAHVRQLLNGAEGFMLRRAAWQKHTLTSAIVCGLPGQGKSEMLRQIALELEALAKKTGQHCRTHCYAVGKDINSQADLSRILAEYRAQGVGSEVVIMVFDEIDKAKNFDFVGPFLPMLEETVTPSVPLTYWLFAQSSYASLDEYKSAALQTRDNTLRDFLTRILWGSVELPELRLVPQQRLMTAIGAAKNRYSTATEMSSRWCSFFTVNCRLESARALMKAQTDVTVLASGNQIDLTPASVDQYKQEYPIINHGVQKKPIQLEG